MADKKALFPEHTQIRYPDGSVYLYLQAGQALEAEQFVSSASGKIVKFKGGRNFPAGITVERVAKDEYTKILIQLPEAPMETTPKIAVPNG